MSYTTHVSTHGNSTSYSFLQRTPCLGCVGNCDNIRKIAAHLKLFHCFLDQLIQRLHVFQVSDTQTVIVSVGWEVLYYVM